MLKLDSLWWPRPHIILSYAVAALSVIAAVVILRWMETVPQSAAAHVSLLLLAVMFSVWFGGMKSGLITIALSVLAFDYYFLPPINSLAVEIAQLPRLILFALSALFVGSVIASQRKSTESLRRSRDELQRTVEQLQEQSTELQASLKSEQELRKLAEERREKFVLLSRRFVDLQESERRKIARELHDEIGQELTAVKLQIESFGKRSGSDKNTKPIESVLMELIKRVRDMSLNLRPAMLDDLGLIPALFWLVNRYGSQTEIKVKIRHKDVDGVRFSPEIETAAYRIVQEALTNIVRHSCAKEASIAVERDETLMRITIRDHGRGFEVESSLMSTTSTGLSGMIERAEAAGGTITISSSLDVGTTVYVELPIGADLRALAARTNV